MWLYNLLIMIGNQTVRHFLRFIEKFPLLTEREKWVLSQRLQEQKLKKIGKKFKVSAERVRQIEWGAILKLKQKYRQLALFE